MKKYTIEYINTGINNVVCQLNKKQHTILTEYCPRLSQYYKDRGAYLVPRHGSASSLNSYDSKEYTKITFDQIIFPEVQYEIY